LLFGGGGQGRPVPGPRAVPARGGATSSSRPGLFRCRQDLLPFRDLVGLHLKWRDVARFGYILDGAIWRNTPIPLILISWYTDYVISSPKGASTMEWIAPQHEEIDLNCEISSYANAEL
jgi:hypothetical protein